MIRGSSTRSRDRVLFISDGCVAEGAACCGSVAARGVLSTMAAARERNESICLQTTTARQQAS